MNTVARSQCRSFHLGKHSTLKVRVTLLPVIPEARKSPSIDCANETLSFRVAAIESLTAVQEAWLVNSWNMTVGFILHSPVAIWVEGMTLNAKT
jgi:hypothetical protein